MLVKHKFIRYFLLLLLGVGGFMLGYLRWTYALIWDFGIKLVPRNYLYKSYSYPDNWHGLVQSLIYDPRWLSAAFYSIAPFLLSLLSVYLIFLKNSYLIKTIWVYLCSWIIVLFLFSLSLIFSSYGIGIGLAQNLKHLLQTPFFSLLLIAAFKMSDSLSIKEYVKR